MDTQTNTLQTLDQFIDEEYGTGTSKRETFEKGYEHFKLGFLLQQARIDTLVECTPTEIGIK